MRTILAIETSTARGSIAVRKHGADTFYAEFTAERGHNAVIFAPLEQALSLAGTIDWIVVGTGPGSYTGVRIGIATALGMSMAKNVPLVGQTSFAALEGAEDRYAVVSNARRGQWQFSELQQGKLIGETLLGNDAETELRCNAFDGPILTIDPASPPFCQARIVSPSALRLARSIEHWEEATLTELSHQLLEPIYLSGPFITMPKVAGLAK